MKTEELHPAIQKELASLLHCSRVHIGNGKEVPPVVFIFEFEDEILTRRGVMGVASALSSETNKELLRGFMEKQVMREEVGFIIFVMEAWAAPFSAEDIRPVLPADHPNKREVVLANVLTKTHQYLLTALITRNPTQVGEFEVRATQGMEGPLARDQEDTPKYH